MHILPFHPQWLPAGGQNPDTWRVVENRLGEKCGGVDDVLATVKNDQHLLFAKKVCQTRNWNVRPQWNFKRGSDGTWNKIRTGHRREIDETGTMFIVGLPCMGQSQRHCRFSDST